jgi:hypothetical protein
MSKIRISGKDHFLHENQTWGRALDFYLQENSYLKTRLSQVVDRNADKEFVAKAEHFNTSFIQNDDFIRDLKKDVSELELSLKKSLAGLQIEEQKLQVRQKKLRNEMEHFEKKFAGLKDEFNSYLISLLAP